LPSRNDLGRSRVRDYRCRARDPDYNRPRRAIDSRCCRLFGITREIMETRAPFDPARDDGALEG
jgi:hypothetical protein